MGGKPVLSVQWDLNDTNSGSPIDVQGQILINEESIDANKASEDKM